MKYDNYRAKFGDEYNPFKNVEKKYILDENEYAIVLANQGPYTDDHLLICPKREVHFLCDLGEKEKLGVMQLVEKRLKKLEKYYDGVSVLLRDGYFRKNGGKSVNHLHWHLIPEIHITSYTSDSRNFLSEEEFLNLTQKIRKKYGQ